MNNSSYFSPFNSFSSATKRKPNLKSNNSTSDINFKKSPPHGLSQLGSSVSKTASFHILQSFLNNSQAFFATSFNFRAHYDLLTYPNGRSPSQSGNGVALVSRPSSLDLSPDPSTPSTAFSSLPSMIYTSLYTIFLSF